MSELDWIYLLVGKAVVWCFGGAGVALFIAACYGALALAFDTYVRKCFNGVRNFHAVWQWDKAGRPEWQWEGTTAHMKPTKTSRKA